jgi:hypothetical protein
MAGTALRCLAGASVSHRQRDCQVPRHGVRTSYTHQYYPSSARPADTLAAHLGFALKHEGVHLEFLARLFDVVPVAELETWVAAEPTGQYARRAGFFYEYLTGRRLAFLGVVSGNYVSALDNESCVTAVRPVNNPRWRVRDNLPGSRDYCPLVLRTSRVQQAERYDCARHLADLEVEFGADVLQRSLVWLTIKESRASFAIEQEGQQLDRVRRFAAVMEQHCGQYPEPLSEGSLGELQAQILGPRATRYGVRRSPVFVGERDGMTELVHYIAPHWDDVRSLLSGLRDFADRTAGASRSGARCGAVLRLRVHSPDVRRQWSHLALPDQRCAAAGQGHSSAVHPAGVGRHHQLGGQSAPLRSGTGIVLTTADAQVR